jgi:signal transduction histidine kinase
MGAVSIRQSPGTQRLYMDDDASFNQGQKLTPREQLVDELARHAQYVQEGELQRNTSLFLAYVFCGFFGNTVLMLVLAVIHVVMEMIADSMERGLDPVASPYRYRLTLGLAVMRTASICTATVMTWQVDSPYAKILATGLGFITLLQLSSVRAIHLRYSILALTTVSVIFLGANTAYWIANGDLVGLLISSFTGLAGISLVHWAMRSNHDLHTSNVRALAQARASDTAKSMFLAQMSHELRTPLNAIIGLGEVEVAKAHGPSRVRLRTLVTSARGLAEVLDDVLDLSAINTGQSTIVPRPTDLRAAISATLAIAVPPANRTGGKPTLSIADSVPEFAFLDAQRLRQCLTNLVSSALKHAAGMGIQVKADYRDDQLLIEVADKGPGIPPDLVETLFEPLQRGNVLRPGLGLGLAISRSLARQKAYFRPWVTRC